MTAPNTVDLDDPATWPTDLSDLIAELASAVPGELDTGSDLHNEVSELAKHDDQVREMLAGRLLRTYHATRLLDHEIEDVRACGLRALTEGSLAERVDRAIKAGSIPARYLNALCESTALVHEPLHAVRHRFGEVSMVSSRQPLAKTWPHRLLSNWGGEVRQFGPVWTDSEFESIRSLGRPSLIIAGIDVSTPPAAGTGRELIFDFIGIHLGVDGNGITIHYTADIPGEQIVDVCHPGHPEYDRHPHFPKR
ncbi:hypothetical protein ABT154_33840 [Streptomyces sp. NPDC001728]|uniref:hypothetical protein n=1 Tax=Streptomyces sp. NPDC001728 TaxID=3154396 RepID=UPI003316C280